MSWPVRLVIWLSSAAFSALTAILAWSRYGTYHNRTFDLALYARQAFGLARGDLWDPITNVHFLGTHLSVVLLPLGLLGRVFETVPVLLCAQALAFGLAALPLARIGARRAGDRGALCATIAFLCYPNLAHVSTYEFHPGSLAVLPLALALDALDRGRPLPFVLASLSLLACRSDLALLTMLLGAAALVWKPSYGPRLPRAAGALLLALSLLYLALSFSYLRPTYWAAHGSFSLHFGKWGGSPLGILGALVHEPAKVAAHLLEPERLGYLPRVLLPLALLPLLAPRFLLFTLPFLAANTISEFPTTTQLYSHYLTLAVPSLVVAALEGATVIAERARASPLAEPLAFFGLALSSLAASQLGGALPWSRDFDGQAFVVDEHSEQAARVVASIPGGASVQAPDALLPHLAERHGVYRAPPPDRGAEYVVLDVSHRVRYARSEDLLRTTEEPLTRTWLARRDYGLVQAEPHYLVLARGKDPRAGITERYFTSFPGKRSALPLTRCLLFLSAWLTPQGLELELFAQAPCPNDLALRLGSDPKPKRVDLLFDGLLSPVHLRDEYLMSFHPLSESERKRIAAHGLRLGALRSSGAPPEPNDPVSVAVPLLH